MPDTEVMKFTQMMGFGLLETLYMTLASTAMAYALGLPLGVVLAVTRLDGIAPCRWVSQTLNVIINLLRSVPFLILLIAVQPITRAITGTTLGSSATVVPLIIASAPFIARLVESSLNEVDKGVIEAAAAMGSSPMRIIFRVMIPESKPGLLTGAAIAVTTILSYSAMAGIVGGGGLGAIAINYGLYRYREDIMMVTVVLLVIVVQVLQEVGMRIAKKSDKR
ncbi:MAG: D-methionine transport system permease protein MetI [Firmicutes bacterium ADurb.Bin182]|nr:MAG: D-methionine transport system permease protein MetI [Firmicutes bacterium ADurb.Bin182]